MPISIVRILVWQLWHWSHQIWHWAYIAGSDIVHSHISQRFAQKKTNPLKCRRRLLRRLSSLMEEKIKSQWKRLAPWERGFLFATAHGTHPNRMIARLNVGTIHIVRRSRILLGSRSIVYRSGHI